MGITVFWYVLMVLTVCSAVENAIVRRQTVIKILDVQREVKIVLALHLSNSSVH